MSLSATAKPGPSLPHTFVGKNGLPIELHRLQNDAEQRLIDMYLAFQPRNSFQGLPPIKDDVCIRWVRDMLVDGIHVVAVSLDNRHAGLAKDDAGETPTLGEGRPIIGHAAIFPVNDKKCEMLVVVCPGFQNLGIGTELVQSCIKLADELGYERIWLPVDATNVRARHVYCKCGFEYVSSIQSRELDMVCNVRTGRPRPIYELHGAASRVPAPRFHFPCLSPQAEEK